MIKILLLEDDQILSHTLQLFLSREGYEVDIAVDISSAEELSFQYKYDLYLFDINLPSGSGLELLKALRHAEDSTPTILITAQTDMHSMEEGFSLDAIDYIKKPFDPQELRIRIAAKFKNNTLSYGDITYNQEDDMLYKNNLLIDLGNVNHHIFTLLLCNVGTIVTKEVLYECFDKSSSTALRVAISSIKQKLDIEIKNIRAKGYMLESL